MTTQDNRTSNAKKVTLILGGARSGKSALAEKLAERRASQEGGVLYVATLLPNDDEMRERVVQHRASRPAHWRTVEAPYKLNMSLLPALQNEQVVLLDCLTTWTANLLMRENEQTDDVLEKHGMYGEIYDDEIALVATHATQQGSTPPLEPDREESITSELQAEVEAATLTKVRPTLDYKPDYTKLEAAIGAELEGLVARLRERGVGLIIVSNEVGMGLVPPYPLGRVYRDVLGRVNQRLAALADEVYMVFAGLPIELKKLQAEMG